MVMSAEKTAAKKRDKMEVGGRLNACSFWIIRVLPTNEGHANIIYVVKRGAKSQYGQQQELIAVNKIFWNVLIFWLVNRLGAAGCSLGEAGCKCMSEQGFQGL